MFVHHIGYRHDNGTIESFAGSGLTPAAARQNSLVRAHDTIARVRRTTFERTRVIDDLASLDHADGTRLATAVPTRAYAAALN